MKILLTGSSGFIGRNLHNVLLQSEEDIKIIPVARSVGIDLEKVDINELPESDLVIHLAGKVGVLGSWDNPDVFFRSNYISTLNTIGYCRKHSASLIYVSSYMYGNPRYLPIDEKHPLSVNNPYAASKLISEELLIKYADLFGLNLTILRPFNLYGPFMPTENLIQFVFEQLRRTNCVIVRDLEPKRDYLHVEDFCKAIDKVVRRIPTGIEVYNVGSGTSVSVLEIIKLFGLAMNKEIEIKSLSEKRVNEIQDCYADIRKISDDFGWMPSVNLLQGIRSLVNSVES